MYLSYKTVNLYSSNKKGYTNAKLYTDLFLVKVFSLMFWFIYYSA
jgi:hypothetical protein